MSDFERSRRAVRPSLDGISRSRPQRRPQLDNVNIEARYRGAHTADSSHATHQPLKKTAKLPGSMPHKPLKLDMSLPGGESGRKQRISTKPVSKWRQIRKWALISTATGLLLILVVGGSLFAKGYFKLHKVLKGGKTAVALQSHVDPNLLKGEGDGRINILLMGKGGPGHDGPDLTDTMLLFSIDPINRTAALVSVPRDLWVNVPSFNSMKINAAYANAKYHAQYKGANATQANASGVTTAEQTMQQVLGVPIHYYAMVDFTAFQQAVDTVGGVRFYVPQDLYDPTMAWQNKWSPVLARKGLQDFDGYHALLYVRSRETSSDFARTERQRQLLVALEQKVFTLGTFSNPLKISSLMDAFGDHAEMDMSITDAMRLYGILKSVDTNKIESIDFVTAPHNFVTTGMMGNQSIVRPVAGLSNYTAIQDYVHSVLRDGYIVKENAKITVLNGTTNGGLATTEANILRSYGYNVGSVGFAPTNNYTKSQVVDLTHGAKKYTAHYLENRFKTPISSQLPQGVQAGDSDFVIIVGNNEAVSSKN